MITIRKAGLKDAHAITELWKEFMRNIDEIMDLDPKEKQAFSMKDNAPELFKKFLIKNIRSVNAGVFIAEVDGKIAGYSLAYIEKNIPVFILKRIGYISDLFVRKEYRGTGVSSRLKDETIGFFRERGIRHLKILVPETDHHARSIYKKWGFYDCLRDVRTDI